MHHDSWRKPWTSPATLNMTCDEESKQVYTLHPKDWHRWGKPKNILGDNTQSCLQTNGRPAKETCQQKFGYNGKCTEFCHTLPAGVLGCSWTLVLSDFIRFEPSPNCLVLLDLAETLRSYMIYDLLWSIVKLCGQRGPNGRDSCQRRVGANVVTKCYKTFPHPSHRLNWETLASHHWTLPKNGQTTFRGLVAGALRALNLSKL